ncbi:hypothetical protein MBLNU459_g3797t1 [Dothideomycetes sp. NU459]
MDPFDRLPDDISLSDLTPDRKGLNDSSEDSLFVRLILVPITMISFVFSLFVVDSNQRAWRVAQHESSSTSWRLSRLAPWLLWSAEPYQQHEDATWQSADDTTSETQEIHGNVPVPIGNEEKWFTHKMHRRMAEWELGEALEMRSKMAIALVIWAFLVTALMAWAVKITYNWLQRHLV